MYPRYVGFLCLEFYCQVLGSNKEHFQLIVNYNIQRSMKCYSFLFLEAFIWDSMINCPPPYGKYLKYLNVNILGKVYINNSQYRFFKKKSLILVTPHRPSSTLSLHSQSNLIFSLNFSFLSLSSHIVPLFLWKSAIFFRTLFNLVPNLCWVKKWGTCTKS